MRIAGGQYKGRIFKPGKSFKARPTTDVAKEGLFNILTNSYYFEELTVLDLFSGTGSISYEFASRGCQNVVLVESNYNHLKFIKQVIELLQNEYIVPIRGDVFKFIQKHKGAYDIIFADPPFDLPNFNSVAELVLNSSLLKKNGLFILEHPKNYSFNNMPGFSEIRKYGSVHFSFFKAWPAKS